MRLHTVLTSSRNARGLLAAVLALGFAACLPPAPPQAGGHVSDASEAAIPAPVSEALQRSAKLAREICLGRGYGEATVTFDSSGAATRAKVARADEIADVDCVEAVFLKTRASSFAGPAMTIVASFELDAMRGPGSAPRPADLQRPRYSIP